MISIDPARDTVEDMHQFVKSFNNSFIGLRADSRTTLALQKKLHVYAIIIPATDGRPVAGWLLLLLTLAGCSASLSTVDDKIVSLLKLFEYIPIGNEDANLEVHRM